MTSKIAIATVGLFALSTSACDLNKLSVTPRYIEMPKEGTILPTQDCGDLFFSLLL